ncbi:hydrogenase formation protein HypD [Desulfobulbus oligotrophicus]|uniref:Hydrogenase formation protein HypD n=1 Tax=Desulfobulbus oligotrophicus TaxID=1909699 RepID=A0A7T6AR18_9BACT|nr:hydrogenase formation protein HypD [Desulfobulbus oligotrophicus]QQG66112.1 hydrogenase formation protein HypD [Desulfobulbus oligotrophicus]
MNWIEGFRSQEVTAPLVEEINRSVRQPVRLMEVCGTHTMSIFRHGIRSLLPDEVQLLSGPGCPVCVTPAGQIDAFVQAADMEKVIVATFGDLIRVPGSSRSLAQARAQGARVEVVYSPMDALALAQQHQEQTVLFPAIGFETTVPAIAATLLQAKRMAVKNFVIVSAGKTMPQALETLMADPQLQVDGLLCPGHVSAIIGSAAYQPLAEKYGLACAVAGFEPADILAGILTLVRCIQQKQATVENCYTRAVSTRGNARALHLINEVFEPVDSEWRGLGMIAASGLQLRPSYQCFDAVQRLGLDVQSVPDPKGCCCGEILKGRVLPPDCPLYGRGCTPLQPIGPCMVSNEGTCAAFYRFSEVKRPMQASDTVSS